MASKRVRSGKSLKEVLTVTDALKSLYRQKLLPLENHYGFSDFHSSSLEDADFDNKPMVLVLGQYSTGKTTFIKYLLDEDHPTSRIGPEPTTDTFTAIMHGGFQEIIPGNALVVDPDKPFRKLSHFGTAFLNRFQCVHFPNQVLEYISIIDTPGILSSTNRNLRRGYDFPAVLRWFAEHVDRIILMCDAQKLEISDEFSHTISSLRGNEEKVRVLLNKADTVDSQQLLRAYGALMWCLSKVFCCPEVPRVYIGSFWSSQLRITENRKLFDREEEELFTDIRNLPRKSALRKLNDLVKRARRVRAHISIITYLKKKMPLVFYRNNKKRDLIAELPVIFTRIQQKYQISPRDFPDCASMQKQLLNYDFAKFKGLKPKLLNSLEEFMNIDIASLMPLLRQEELEAADHPGVQGGAFLGYDRVPFFGNPFYPAEPSGECEELSDEDWVVFKDKPKYDMVFYSLSLYEGKLNGTEARHWMLTTRLPSTVLSRIWKLADVDCDGMLDNEEFALASHLIQVKLAGIDLPFELPAHLVPPSKRKDKTALEDNIETSEET